MPVLLHVLFALAFSSAAASESCAVGTCDGSTKARKVGGIMIQTRTQKTAAQSVTNKDVSSPTDGQYIMLTTRVSDMELRVNKLQTDSGKGREALKTQLADLTASVDAMKSSGTGSLDDTISRVGASEGHVSTLRETVAANNAALRQGVEMLREEYVTLSKNVGDAFASASALQTGAAQAPAADAAPAAAVAAVPVAPVASAVAAAPVGAGGGLTGRTTTLEAKVAALETASDSERESLKDQVHALDLTVDTLRAGGVTSVEHTTSRVGSTEKQLGLERESSEQSSAAIRADILDLTAKVDDLSAHVGALAMLQTDQDPAKALPLTNRIESLESRIGQLEDKSSRERGTLKLDLDTLAGKVDEIKSGGVSSLEHTTLRQTSVETDTAALQIAMTGQKTSLDALTATLKAKLNTVRAHVGASRLESA